jgi:hypothetical protein
MVINYTVNKIIFIRQVICDHRLHMTLSEDHQRLRRAKIFDTPHKAEVIYKVSGV